MLALPALALLVKKFLRRRLGTPLNTATKSYQGTDARCDKKEISPLFEFPIWLITDAMRATMNDEDNANNYSRPTRLRIEMKPGWERSDFQRGSTLRRVTHTSRLSQALFNHDMASSS